MKKLKECCGGDYLCAVYADVEHTSKFVVGYVLANDSDMTIIQLVDPYGKYDGIACILTDKIFCVDTDTKYLRAIKKLVDYNKEDCNYVKKWYKYADVLFDIHQSKRICEIELCESGCDDVSGFIVDINATEIEVLCVSEYGDKEGKSLIRRDTISEISYDSLDTKKLEILAKN